MYYVYILKSQKDSKRIYVGLTNDIEKRIKEHNSALSYYSKRYAPWELVTFIGFKGKDLAVKFEKYLKNGSGFAFLKRHLLESVDYDN